jgi:hypothetical protein
MNNNAIANKKDIIFYLQSLKGGQGINEYNKYIERIQVSINIFLFIKIKFRKILKILYHFVKFL